MFRIVIIFLLGIPTVLAHTATISLDEFDQALDRAIAGEDALQQFLVNRIHNEFERLQLKWEDGQLIKGLSAIDQKLDGGCGYSAYLKNYQGQITVKDDTTLGLSVASLNRPIQVELAVNSSVKGSGNIDQHYGVKLFGDCRRYATDAFDLEISGDLQFSLIVKLEPSIEIRDTSLTYTPQLTVITEFTRFSYELDVGDTLLEDPLENKLRDVIDDAFSAKKLQEYGKELEEQMIGNLSDNWGGDSVSFDFPRLESAQIQKLMQLLDISLFSGLGENLVRDHLPELLYALVTEDEDIANGVFSGVAICELLTSQMRDLPSIPMYKLQGGICTAEDSPMNGEVYYSDVGCQSVFDYYQQSQENFCEMLLDSNKLGNAANIDPAQIGAWGPSLGSTLDVGVVPLETQKQPFVTQVNYLDRLTEAGLCELEMRVFKTNPTATNLKPLIAFHGGSWTYRRDGVLGLEAQITNYTDRGFIVFEPFYRVTGNGEANPECSQATGRQVNSDVLVALDWVMKNASRYGANQDTVTVTGQSAGAHLAMWLVAQRPQSINKALLLYPPTDMAHFVGQWQAGVIKDDNQGISAIERFIGKPVAAISVDDPQVLENSYPTIIAQNPSLYPPVFILHGSGDSLVPIDQSTRLCGAYSSDPEATTFTTSEFGENYSLVVKCGDYSQLHIIEDAEHALDVCLFDVWCPAGGEQAQAAVEKALKAAWDWL